MRRGIVTVILILISFLLQTTVLHYIELGGVIPNILLIITVYTGYINGRTPGIIAGLVCGFILDGQYGDLIGLYALIYMTIGYVNGLSNRIFYREDTMMPLVLVAISEIVYGVLVFVLEFLLRGKISLGYYLGRVMMPELVYTLVVSIFLYKFILWLYKIVEHPDDKGGARLC